MIDKIKESDWKYLKKIKPTLLTRACNRINKEAKVLLENEDGIDQYQLYMDVYRFYKRKDEMIAECFDDYRRSKAKMRILSLVRYGIMTEEELQGFSDDTKETVKFFITDEKE